MAQANFDELETVAKVLAVIDRARLDGSPIVYDPAPDEQAARIAIRR